MIGHDVAALVSLSVSPMVRGGSWISVSRACPAVGFVVTMGVHRSGFCAISLRSWARDRNRLLRVRSDPERRHLLSVDGDSLRVRFHLVNIGSRLLRPKKEIESKHRKIYAKKKGTQI